MYRTSVPSRRVARYYVSNAEISAVALASRGRLLGINAINDSAGVLFLQVFNLAVVPTTEAPNFAVRFAANSGTSAFSYLGLTQDGIEFPAGIAVGWSSTLATYTAAAAGTGLWATVFYDPM